MQDRLLFCMDGRKRLLRGETEWSTSIMTTLLLSDGAGDEQPMALLLKDESSSSDRLRLRNMLGEIGSVGNRAYINCG